VDYRVTRFTNRSAGQLVVEVEDDRQHHLRRLSALRRASRWLAAM